MSSICLLYSILANLLLYQVELVKGLPTSPMATWPKVPNHVSRCLNRHHCMQRREFRIAVYYEAQIFDDRDLGTKLVRGARYDLSLAAADFCFVCSIYVSIGLPEQSLLFLTLFIVL